MRHEHIEGAPLRKGSKALEFYNIERVRRFMERNLGCRLNEIEYALNLNPRTVAKAVRIIRATSVASIHRVSINAAQGSAE